MSGWIKLHRKLTEWEWYDDPIVWRVYSHLLLTVNYKPSRYRGHELPVGSRVFGRFAYAEEVGLSEGQVRRAIDKLKSTGEVTIKPTNKFSIISVTNWEIYQADDQQNDQQAVSKRPTSDQQATTSKEGKKERKKESNKAVQRPDDVPSELWSDFLAHRRSQRATLTLTALKGFEREAAKANLPLHQAIQISIERGWRGFKADWVKPEDRPKPQLVHSSETVTITVHEEPEVFDQAMHWSMQHVPGFREKGQEFLKVPANVAANLRKHWGQVS